MAINNLERFRGKFIGDINQIYGMKTFGLSLGIAICIFDIKVPVMFFKKLTS